jgi:hypothetical protein
MLTKHIFIFAFFTVLISVCFAANNTIDDNFNMKAGLSLSRIYLKTSLIPSDKRKEDHTESAGFGFNTSAGYKWTNWEVMVASDVFFGQLKDLSFKVNSTEVTGDGYFRVFTVSPLTRYYTPYSLWNRWNVYASVGPTWSLHTFIISNTLNGTSFDHKKRISFENRGGSLNIGVEEIVPYKEAHPTFFELGYSYMRSHQIYIVDASNFTDVVTLDKQASKDFNGHYFIARFGITLF